MEKTTYTKKVFAIAMAFIVSVGLLYGLVQKIQNGDCIEANNFCEDTVNKISDQVEIIENNVGELNFDE